MATGEFTALLQKNYIIWKRNKASLIAEYVIIVMFAFVLGTFRKYSTKIDKPNTSYLNVSDPHTPLKPELPYPQDYADLSLFLFNRAKQTQFATNVLFKNCKYDPDSNRKTGGYIGLAPDNWITREMSKVFEQVFQYKVKYFKDNADIDQFVTADLYGDPDPDDPNMPLSLCLAVSFNETTQGKWRYSVRFNETGNPSWYDVMDLGQPQVIKFQKEVLTDYHWKNQINSGFGMIQELVQYLVIKNETSAKATVSSNVVIAPVKAYSILDMYSNTDGGDLSFFILFPLMINFLKFIYNMLNEKEKRITENLRNQGMSLYNHYASWLAFNTFVLMSTTLIWAVITCSVIFTASNFLLIWWMMFFPGLVLQSFAFFVCAVCQKAKSGIIAGIVLLFLVDLARVAKQAVTNPSENLIRWLSISPAEATASASSIVMLLESYADGIGWDTLGSLVNNYRYTYFIQTQLIGAFVVLVIGVYLDQVWPSEIGIRRHPLFFILDRFKSDAPKKVRINSNQEPLVEGGSVHQENFEEVEEILRAQSDDNKTLKINNLRKVYSNGKVAVEKLNLEMFSDQIFALLGHNGAGKTTTISMISGLLTQSSGTITLLGRDTREEARENRKILGVCPQTNPIYENLSCKEHLVLYATIKQGKADKAAGKEPVTDKEIERILADLDLLDKKDYPASKLSGGQKRKLCVACAFIGGSKVVLLDEPTSGMDTYARRYLWEMLKIYKKDRIIILSTHYMDEADYLGDRIGIMGKGKLITVGSSLFLKKKFGVGYDLTVVKKSAEVSSDQIEKAVTKYVPSAYKAGEISMEIKFQLPAADSDKFEALFKDFEQNEAAYGIQTFGISLTTLEEVFLKVARLDDDEEAFTGQKKDKIAETIENEQFELNDIRVKGPSQVFFMHFFALIRKRFIYFKRDKRGLVCEIFLPIIIILFGMYMTTIKFIKESNHGVLEPAILGKSNFKWGNANSADHPELNSAMDRVFKSYPDINVTRSAAQDLAAFDTELMGDNDPKRYYSAYIHNYDSVAQKYNYSCFVNTTAPMGINICLNLMDKVFYQIASSKSDSAIDVDIMPFKLTKQVASFQNTAVGFIAATIVSIAFAFIPASLIVIIVKERENNVKHQQIVSGVSVYAYWLSNLTVDFVKYLIPCTATIGIMFAYKVEALIKDDALSATLSLFLLFGLGMIIFVYLISFMFKSPSKAQFIAFLMSYLGGTILMVASFIFRLLEATRDPWTNFVEFVLRLLPIYNLAFGLFSMANTQIWEVVWPPKEKGKKMGPWEFYTALWMVVFLAVTSIVYFLFILLIEYRGNRITQRTINPQEHRVEPDTDEDVINEKQNVASREDFAVKVHDLFIEYIIQGSGLFKRKAVDKKLAVKGVSFGVEKGECFGLLGTNGAGKTSTFKVLSGEILPNFGTAKIAGLNVETDMKEIGSLIGYCPQFDALLENLTAREHLELYAAIKGIPANMRGRLIDNKLLQLNLKQYENVLAGTYSGGNKRKLSVAIALLGNPPIILLDEPSSGMDPEARRFMWSIVSQISTQNKTSSVILTTHSMEEAEALSSKLAIMVEGKVKCIGPVQRLKSKYGQGFEIETKIKLPTDAEVKALQAKISTLSDNVVIDTQEKAISILRDLGLQNPEEEFLPTGKCNHFAVQVESL